MSTPAATITAPAKSRTEIAGRIGWTLLILATLYVCYFRNLGAIGFVGPDEPRYAWVAREMAESGDWVTPRLYGKPWFEKPPLLYWGAALSFKLFGVSEAAARLPSAVSALLATLALAWLAWRIYGADTARWLLLLLPTTVGMLGFSHACATDMPFSAMLTIALVAAAILLDLECGGLTPPLESRTGTNRVLIVTSSIRFTAAVFGFFLALAVLAKGPVAMILCGGAVFFWALFTKCWRDSLRLLHPAAIAAFCITALPWYIFCARRNPDFLRIFIVEHNFNRFLTPEFQHIQPWWYFLPISAIALLPWLMWALAFRGENSSDGGFGLHRDCVILLLTWGLFPILFFSVSESKLPGYILPSVPPLSLLALIAACRAMESKRSAARWPLLAIGFLFIASIAWAFQDLFHYRDQTQSHWTFTLGAALVFLFAIPATVGGVAIVITAALKEFRFAQMIAAISFLLMIAIAQDSLRKFSPEVSARTVASHIKESGKLNVFSFELRRAWLYQLNFYFHREVQEWTPAEKGTALVVTPAKAVPILKGCAKNVEIVDDLWKEANVVRIEPLAPPPNRKP